MNVNESRRWDPIAGGCLILIIFITSYALELTYWTFELNHITAVALLSAIFGLLIGASSFSLGTARIFVFLYSLVIYLWQLVFSLSSEPLWMNRLLEFQNRVATAYQQLARNVPLEDGILFLSAVSLLFCIAGIMSGFRLTRFKDPWAPLGVFITAFFAIQFFLPESQRKYPLILIFTIISLVLLGRLNYLKNRQIWQQHLIKEDADVSLSLMKAIALFAVILTFISFGVPLIYRLVIDQTEDSAPYRQEYSTSWDILRNFLFPLRQQGGFGEGGFNPVMGLGTSRSLKEEQVFSVQVPENTNQATRFYWRARVYDTYTIGYWESSNGQIETLENPEFDPYAPQLNDFSPFLFNYEQASEIVLTPPVAAYVERTVEVSYSLTDGGKWDISTILDPSLVRSGESVLVEGSVNYPSMNDLRQAGMHYPDWVKSKYLATPADLSPNLKSLAEEITSQEEAVIDKAARLTDYLRNSFKYQNYVDIPQDDDPVEWFLFKGRQGFCNYFASAEVLMLRSLGIPSRLVVGYSQGDRVDSEAEFEVLIKDSHAWAEIYFPGIGWIILEPTPLQPAVEYAETVIQEKLQVDPHEQAALQNFENEQDQNLQIFRRISDKYVIEETQTSEEIKYFRRILPWIIFILLGASPIITFVQFFVLREDQYKFPLIIQREMKSRGIKSPSWITKWAAYERLDQIEKMFTKLKLISRLIINKNELEETPKEFLLRLYDNIHLDRQEQQLFINSFHQDVYGLQSAENENILNGIYRHILQSITTRAYTNLKDKIVFRLKLLRIR